MLLDAHTAVPPLDPAAPLAMLLHHFDLIVQTPADVDKLDAAILQLAVEGKLVAQDPSEESALALLERIKARKKQLAKDKEISRVEEYPPIPMDEIPYSTPTGWIWTRLAEVGIVNPRNKADDDTLASFIPMTLINDGYGSGHTSETRAWGEIRKGYTHFGEGDVAVAKITPCFQNRKSTVLRELTNGLGAGTTELHIFRPVDDTVIADYALLFFQSLRFIEEGVASMTGTAGQQRVSTQFFEETLFPLPPLAEQKRIVARVDELRRHTAALRAELAAAAQDAVTVNNAALNRLHTAEDADAFAAAWQTLRHAFDPLYSVPQNLTALRQTILQLAVQGKLVPQDPNDEPATELIKRIEAEKKRLYDEKRLPLLKKPPRVDPKDIPFKIPNGWVWARSSDVCLSINDGDHLPPPKTESGVPFLVISNIRTGQLDFSNTRFVSHDYYKNLNPSRKPQIGDILYSIVGSLGIPVLMETDLIFCFQRHIALFRPGTEVNSKYMYYLLMSPFVFQQSRDYATGIAQLTIPLSGLRKLLFPIPPLAEQERIVAKVDELLALCDLLEGELIEAEAVRVRVVDAVLAGV